MRGREEGSEERAEVNKGEILDPFEASLPASLLLSLISSPLYSNLNLIIFKYPVD